MGCSETARGATIHSQRDERLAIAVATVRMPELQNEIVGIVNVIKPVAGPCQEQDNPLCPRSSSQILPPIPRLRLSAQRGVTLGVTVRVAALDSRVSHASAPAGRRTHATTTTTRTKKLLL